MAEQLSSFLGEYPAKLDAKGRVKIPTGLGKQLPEGDKRFVINRGFEDCLTLYPWQEWDRFSKRVSKKLNPFNKKHRAFLRVFFRGATEVALDASDRLLIPKSLQEHAGISKEVVLFAHTNKVELWDKSKYSQSLEMDSDEFSDLAEEVMGGFDDDDLS